MKHPRVIECSLVFSCVLALNPSLPSPPWSEVLNLLPHTQVNNSAGVLYRRARCDLLLSLKAWIYWL